MKVNAMLEMMEIDYAENINHYDLHIENDIIKIDKKGTSIKDFYSFENIEYREYESNDEVSEPKIEKNKNYIIYNKL